MWPHMRVRTITHDELNMRIAYLKNTDPICSIIHFTTQFLSQKIVRATIGDVIAKIGLKMDIKPSPRRWEQVKTLLGYTCLCVIPLNILIIYKLCIHFYNTNRIYATIYVATYCICIM
jgi:hypothetical protein